MADAPLTLLALANALLSGKTVAKAEGQDPDDVTPNADADSRVEGGAASDAGMKDAREEAQAGQAANPAPGGEEGAAAPGTAPGGEPDGD